MRNIYKHVMEDAEENIDIPYDHQILKVDVENGKVILWINAYTGSSVTSATLKLRGAGSEFSDSPYEYYVDTIKTELFTWHLYIEYFNAEIEHPRSMEERKLADQLIEMQGSLSTLTSNFVEAQQQLNDLRDFPQKVDNLNNEFIELQTEFVKTETLLDERFFAYVNSMMTVSLVALIFVDPLGIIKLLTWNNEKIINGKS